ncbi:TPA: transferase, partial [Streptococcus pneumoniae]|nr:transferase [Streptococcus pneumoniae]
SCNCKIGNNVNISPGVILSGNVKIDDNVFIGAGATIRDAVSIGFGAIIGAGATVIHNVPENAVVVGTPGKIIKYRSV